MEKHVEGSVTLKGLLPNDSIKPGPSKGIKNCREAHEEAQNKETRPKGLECEKASTKRKNPLLVDLEAET